MTMPEVAVGAGLTALVSALAFGGLREVAGTQERVVTRVERQESVRRLGAHLRSDVARMVPGQIRVSTTGRTLALKYQRPATGETTTTLAETVTVLYTWDAAGDDGLALTRKVKGPDGWEGPAKPVPLVQGASEGEFAVLEGVEGWLRARLELPEEGSGELLAALPDG